MRCKLLFCFVFEDYPIKFHFLRVKDLDFRCVFFDIVIWGSLHLVNYVVQRNRRLH